MIDLEPTTEGANCVMFLLGQQQKLYMIVGVMRLGTKAIESNTKNTLEIIPLPSTTMPRVQQTPMNTKASTPPDTK